MKIVQIKNNWRTIWPYVLGLVECSDDAGIFESFKFIRSSFGLHWTRFCRLVKKKSAVHILHGQQGESKSSQSKENATGTIRYPNLNVGRFQRPSLFLKSESTELFIMIQWAD
ncbi:unnamed protein product [Caenorhabditis nigoni]